ncbi:MAG TPA: hypothetical protein VHE99_04570 [Gammaproteobacteria bacterium]|nr:hypothetical protein [Gammaproteobacteria bacterium]
MYNKYHILALKAAFILGTIGLTTYAFGQSPNEDYCNYSNQYCNDYDDSYYYNPPYYYNQPYYPYPYNYNYPYISGNVIIQNGNEGENHEEFHGEHMMHGGEHGGHR